MCETLSSLLLFRRRARSRQSLLHNQFHRIFHRNLGDSRVLVHPAQLVIRLGVCLHLFPHIVLWVRQMTWHALHPRFRRKVWPRFARRRRRFVRPNPVVLQPLVNADGKNERRNDGDSEIRQKFEDRQRPDVRRFKRHVRVLRPLAVALPVAVLLSAHAVQAPPKDLGRPAATMVAASGSWRKIPATIRSVQAAPRCPATSAPPAT